MSDRKLGRWGLISVAAAVLGASLMLPLLPDASSPQEPSVQDAPPATLRAQNEALLEAKAADISRQRLAKLPEPEVPDVVGGFSREAVGGVLSRYREMLSVQGLYNQNVTRERLVNQILDSPQGADIASKALTDPAFAQEAFRDFQAEARVFSIEVLKAAAARGQEHYLVRATEAISQELSRSGDGSGTLDKGRSSDLRDLVHSFVDVKGLDAFAQGDVRPVQALGFSSTMPTRVKLIYDEVLFLRLKQQFGRERAAEMTAALLDH
ncbi:hypothetical protein [Stigmatella aurantiaca]|nr:hypothetical protein [Stigmatella aurantiaca]